MNSAKIAVFAELAVCIVSLLAAGTVDEQVRCALEAKDTGQRALLEALRSK